MNEIITERLREYEIKNADDELNALKEITQEIILYALSKTSFFKRAHFIGGTALRIVHSLNRFSEDMDFTTKNVDPGFKFDDYMEDVLSVLKYYGLEMIVRKSKDDHFVKTRELKEDSEKWKISFPSNKQLKKVVIKLEIDSNPPLGAVEKNANLDFPILHQIKVGTLETMFAGKIHALLSRPYTKGRDWYDLLWYIKKRSKINFQLLQNALFQMGPFKGQVLENVNREFVINELGKKIRALDWNVVRRDVERFVRPDELDSLKLWNEEVFLDRIERVQN